MNCRILVVDDNQTIHDDVKKILNLERDDVSELESLEQELLGAPQRDAKEQVFEIESAYQGQDALALVTAAVDCQQPYMMAFVDIRMPPGWDGVETVAHLWEVDPDLQVVICTAYSDRSWDDIVRQLRRSDSLLIIKKPFDSIEVLQAAHALTRKWLLKREVDRKVDNLEAAIQLRTRDLEQLTEKLKEEIAVRKTAEDRLKHIATHDSLTGLPNRVLLHDRLENSLSVARRHSRLIAVMLMDLDHFKDVNDAYGHNCGDLLLQEAAARLTRCTRDYDTVARMGGDEFVVVAAEIKYPEECEALAGRIVDAFQEPFTIDGHVFSTTASVGISVFPLDCTDIESLLKSADMAMYRAKENGGGQYRFFDCDRTSGTGEMARAKHLLNRAVDRDELSLHYQPLLDLISGQLVGMEALCRWNSNELGLVDPMKFIPLAECTGAIVPIGTWVLNTACRQNAAWQARGFPEVAIAVNFSARQFRSRDLVESIENTLAEAGLAPRHLVMEITESSLMTDIDECRKKLEAVDALGVKIVVDDFGSGFSSLNRLKTLPIHGLKIDRFFVQNIVDDPRDAAIVMAIIALAHSLKIQVIAEGIETVEQLNFLRTMRWECPQPLTCDVGQGFFFARPVPAAEAEAFFAEAIGRRAMIG